MGMGRLRRAAKTRKDVSGSREEIEATVEVSSCDYRRFGDDRTLLSVELRAVGGLRAGIRLRSQTPDQVRELQPAAVTLLPESASTLLLFVVDLGGLALDHARLELAIDGEPAVPLPVPSELRPFGTPGCDLDLDHAVASSLAGDQLQGVATMLERRCATAERALEDLRVESSEPRKLAQAYRECWELRTLLDDREDAYRQGNSIVEAADAARHDAESATEAVRTELDEVRADRDRIQTELLEELEMRGDAIARLEAAVTESGAAVEAWAVEAERARTQLAEAVDRAEVLEAERDEAWSAGERLAADLAHWRGAAAAAHAKSDAAHERLADAVARVAVLETQCDESDASASTVREELTASRELLSETEGVLERERNLYEARIASGAESERTLRSRVDELEARLGEERSSRGVLQRRKATIAQSFADAQRARLREATLDEQRTQVAALERQLEQIKQRSAERGADDASTPAA
jgi:chromosome segregation ATPase